MPPRDDLAARTGARFLYPFRARNPLTGKWYRASYLAERHVIAAFQMTAAGQLSTCLLTGTYSQQGVIGHVVR